MFLLFAAMGLMITVAAFGFYYKHKVTVYQNKEQEELEKQAEQIAHKLDAAIEKMEFAVSFILSDRDALDGMQILSRTDGLEEERYESAEAIRNIRITLGAWYLNRNFSNDMMLGSKHSIFYGYSPA